MTITPPKGEPIPDTVEAWKHYAGLLADKVNADRETIQYLKQRINKLEQALEKAKK